MQVTVTEAKARLTELVRRAEAGEEIVLTRHGHPAVRLVPAARNCRLLYVGGNFAKTDIESVL